MIRGILQNELPSADPPSMLVAPQNEYYRWKEGRFFQWSRGTVRSGFRWDPGRSGPMHALQGTFRLDSTQEPRRLDAVYGYGGTAYFTIPGIYAWRDDVLVWAFPAAFSRADFVNGGPTGEARPPQPPAGFQPEQLNQAVVIYLMRVDPKSIAIPDDPVGDARIR